MDGIWPRWQARIGTLVFDSPCCLLPVLAVGYFGLWAALLTVGKSTQIIHFDSAEAYAWGQQLAWGYGKHPPVSGWIAWAWFSIFPARDWAMYALAMAVTGVTFALLWLLARQTVDSRRALLMACLLLVYPIFNFKGYKYNADLALMPFIVLVALTFVVAFERRTVLWGVALGLAGALAMLTKYWGGWSIIAVALAALLHSDRKRFFLSPTPYVAGGVFLAAMLPHVLWLLREDFTPFRYASAYAGATESLAITRAETGTGQALALLLPVAAAAFVALWPTFRTEAADARAHRAQNLWVVVAALTVLPPIATALLGVRMKSDWDIPMYTMVPLAMIAWPRLAVTERTVGRASAVVLGYCLVAVLVMPFSSDWKYYGFDRRAVLPRQLDKLALTATDLWHERFGTRLPVVAGWELYAAPITFYSPDHPQLFTEADPKLAPWIDTAALDHTGFLGICRASDVRCLARISAWRPESQRVEITTDRAAAGKTAKDTWVLLLAAPKPKLAAQYR